MDYNFLKILFMGNLNRDKYTKHREKVAYDDKFARGWSKKIYGQVGIGFSESHLMQQ